jgi:hypothetical protein
VFDELGRVGDPAASVAAAVWAAVTVTRCAGGCGRNVNQHGWCVFCDAFRQRLSDDYAALTTERPDLNAFSAKEGDDADRE